MRDTMNPLTQFSPQGGELVEEAVPGTLRSGANPENDVDVRAGRERSMFCYVPAGGCPHPKQTQVLMVLRDDAGRESAERLLRALELDRLAEDRHFVVVFPNPEAEGWNDTLDPARDDDAHFLVRCFAALPSSRGGVGGFNGMIFHLACSPAASAMVMALAATSPLDAAAVMVGALPEGRTVPVVTAPLVAWLYERDPDREAHLATVNRTSGAPTPIAGALCHADPDSPCVRHFVSDAGLTASEVAAAWEHMFSETRRWRNDTHGTYQPRVRFDERGFVAHLADPSLVGDGLARTWFEYVPPALRGSDAPVPLVIYLHGVNCVGLYGAEQSGWADLADRDGFVAVFPEATLEERWNVWDDPRLPSDVSFVLALIDRIGESRPIDPGRVYLSGFSMGSMFANALACSHPEVFAGAVALNGPNLGYLQTLEESRPLMLQLRRDSILEKLLPADRPASPTRDLAETKWGAGDVRMPFVQCVGLLDDIGFDRGRIWPLQPGERGLWPATVDGWKRRNGVPPSTPVFDAATVSGLAADVTVTTGPGDRIIHQSWRSSDGGSPPLYHFVSVRRLAHAVDPHAIDLGWGIVRQFARDPDGELRLLAQP